MSKCHIVGNYMSRLNYENFMKKFEGKNTKRIEELEKHIREQHTLIERLQEHG